jgi:hypothetical protein
MIHGILCALGLHDWSKWSNEREGIIRFPDGSTRDTRIQDRRCLTCNKYQISRVTQSYP